MNRLTKKDPCINCEKENECRVNCKKEFYFYKEIKSKLGKLEDIEDELGCPLDVVSRAMKYGIEFEHKLTNDKLISKSIRIFYFQNEWVIRAYIEKYKNDD